LRQITLEAAASPGVKARDIAGLLGLPVEVVYREIRLGLLAL